MRQRVVSADRLLRGLPHVAGPAIETASRDRTPTRERGRPGPALTRLETAPLPRDGHADSASHHICLASRTESLEVGQREVDGLPEPNVLLAQGRDLIEARHLLGLEPGAQQREAGLPITVGLRADI